MNVALVFFIVTFEQISHLKLPLTFSRYFLPRDLTDFNIFHKSNKAANSYCAAKF